MHVAMLLYPRLTQLDLTGPFEVFKRMPGVTVDLVWKSLDPVEDASGLRLLPSATFETCPKADILFVPGGPGQIELMADVETLAFLRRLAAEAEWVTSVCTGSLVLAAAGLITGRRATCHWTSIDQLALFGVEPVAERVVFDGNVVTGAGVTSGIDFALALSARLFSEAAARRAELSMEYDPAPPFHGGSPATADAATLQAVRSGIADFLARRLKASEAAALALVPHP